MVLASGRSRRMEMEVATTSASQSKIAELAKFDTETMCSIIQKLLGVLSPIWRTQSLPLDHFVVMLESSAL